MSENRICSDCGSKLIFREEWAMDNKGIARLFKNYLCKKCDLGFYFDEIEKEAKVKKIRCPRCNGRDTEVSYEYAKDDKGVARKCTIYYCKVCRKSF